jgi:hypothetical protein
VEKSSRARGLQSIADILQQTLFPEGPTAPTTTKPQPHTEPLETTWGPTGRYDFDLAEFPFFHFDKNPDKPLTEPITYTDTINGKDGQTVVRQWKVYPSAAYGFGGQTTQLVLYDLLQLYIEQGCKGTKSSLERSTTCCRGAAFVRQAHAITNGCAATLKYYAAAASTVRTRSGTANDRHTWT